MESRLVLVPLVLLVVPTLVAAQGGAAPEAPKPAPELAQLQRFDGTWTCTGYMSESSLGPGHRTEGAFKGGADPKGLWYSGRYEEKKTAENPGPVTATMVWGYDANQKRFTSGLGSCLAATCRQSSPGWQGDSMVWTGDGVMGGRKVVVRDTYSAKGNVVTHQGELEMDGKWIVVDEETCKKVGP